MPDDTDDILTDDTLTDAELRQLRDVFLRAGYTVGGAESALSTAGQQALVRGEIVPALRAVSGRSARDTLVRLFVLGCSEPVPDVAAALRPVSVSRLQNAGVLAVGSNDRVAARLDIRPYGAPELPWYVVSDRTPVGPGRERPLSADHVLGVGGASLTLVGAVPRRPVVAALDLGTGCGVQALHLATHAERVVATDSNPRALRLARMTAVLSNQPPPQLRSGDLFDPVAQETFDLVVSNPPFVVGPDARFAYRDSGLPGDELSRRVIRGAAGHLATDGVAVVLANWLHVAGEDWRDRVRGWLSGLGCAAWALQREVQAAAEYAELWLRDSGDVHRPDYEQRYAQWLDWFDRHGASAVGFGVVALRRSTLDHRLRLDDAPQEVEGSLGDVFTRWFHAVELLTSEEQLLQARLRPADAVRLVDERALTADGWQRAEQRLVQRSGLHRSARVDDVTAALVAGCARGLPLHAVLDLLALGYDVDRSQALEIVRGLVDDGYLVPADASQAATDVPAAPG